VHDTVEVKMKGFTEIIASECRPIPKTRGLVTLNSQGTLMDANVFGVV
jgi:formate-dependent phosphoribosylglycinamide formyltransferase (GAR transformylase)